MDYHLFTIIIIMSEYLWLSNRTSSLSLAELTAGYHLFIHIKLLSLQNSAWIKGSLYYVLYLEIV